MCIFFVCWWGRNTERPLEDLIDCCLLVTSLVFRCMPFFILKLLWWWANPRNTFLAKRGCKYIWSANATKGALGANIRKPTFVVHELGWIAQVFGHIVHGGCPTYCLTTFFGPSSWRPNERMSLAYCCDFQNVPEIHPSCSHFLPSIFHL